MLVIDASYYFRPLMCCLRHLQAQVLQQTSSQVVHVSCGGSCLQRETILCRGSPDIKMTSCVTAASLESSNRPDEMSEILSCQEVSVDL